MFHSFSIKFKLTVTVQLNNLPEEGNCEEKSAKKYIKIIFYELPE